MELIFYSFEVLTSTTKLQSINFIGPLVMEIHHLQFSVGISDLKGQLSHSMITILYQHISQSSDPTKNCKWCISITNGPMKLILCSFVVLVSTSKPQNMSSEVDLVFEIAHVNLQILKVSAG